MRMPRLGLARSIAALIAIGGGLRASPAFAQTAGSSAGGSPDLVPVVLWTVVAAIVGLGAVSVGYLYRRQRGFDHPLHIPPPGEEVHAPEDEHVVTRHAEAGHADETEQAELAHRH